MISETRKRGARAAKVCGAGGGGCVVFLVEPGSKAAVENTLLRLGGEILHFGVSRTGLEVRSNGSAPGREA